MDGRRTQAATRENTEQLLADALVERREALLRLHAYRLRRADLEECLGQAALEVLVASRRGRRFSCQRHVRAALEQRVLSRITDQQRDLYAATIEAYQRALKLTQAQHAAGVTLLSDVALAQSQLATAQATAVDLDAQRALLEHAIAILTGRAPAQFAYRRAGLRPTRQRVRQLHLRPCRLDEA